MLKNQVLMVGIAGGSGSGKTTFAKKVLNHISDDTGIILHMDAYYLPKQPESNFTDKGRANFDHPQAFDWDLLRSQISNLREGQGVDCPIYNYHKSFRTDQVNRVGPSKVVLFEGIFTLYDEKIRDLLDIKCFLHVDSDIRFTRRLHRDVKERGRSLESVIEQYYDTVRPMYQKYLNPQSQHADFTVGEETDVAAEILAARIKEIVRHCE